MFWTRPLALAALQLLLSPISFAQDPTRPYSLPDSSLGTTSILDQASYITEFDDPQWYLDNIPFVDFPDKTIQDVYYYRCSVIKRHLKYGHEGQGWVFTEFIHPVAWGNNTNALPIAQGITDCHSLKTPNHSRLRAAPHG
jgi:hypothetical protein